MNFKSVFRTLQELFPQIDLRVLKAVAIEHSKDADAAIEFILSEVMPSPGVQREDSISSYLHLQNSSKSQKVHPSSPVPSAILGRDEATFIKDAELGELINGTLGINHVSSVLTGKETPLSSSNELAVESVKNDIPREYQENQIHKENIELLEVILKEAPVREVQQPTQEENNDQKSYEASSPLLDISHSSSGPLVSLQELNGLESPQRYSHDFSKSSSGENHGSSNLTSSNSHGEGLVATERVDEVMVTQGEETMLTNHAANGRSARSNQVVSVEYLEELVNSCKGTKSTLANEINSIMDLMKEVDLCEKETSLAKEEASEAGLDTLAKVKDLKEMLKYAEEANNMHAGEVYGEKSILATEAKELQSRLYSLSERRHNTLAIIEEIRQTLRARIDAAEKERIKAENEKSQKEAEARIALEEQENFMNRVVQESKKLNEEALENSKLREFLMDRGRLVDTLQGEISLICDDVLRLKEKVDQGLPLARSPSLSFSMPIAASSVSSSMSSASAKEDSKEKLIPRGDIQVGVHFDHEYGGDVDDGWEYFDRDSELIGAIQDEKAWRPNL